MPTARQISTSDLIGKPFCRQHPIPDSCADHSIMFKAKVRGNNWYTWWVTCTFNVEKRDVDCVMTQKFSSILCYDLSCSSKWKKKTEFRILASSLDITKFFFEIRVRQGNRCTWWVTCNFNQRKETTNATEMTHRFSSILCYDLICSCNKVKRTTEFRILASSLDITVSTFSCYYSQARSSALRAPPPPRLVYYWKDN